MRSIFLAPTRRAIRLFVFCNAMVCSASAGPATPIYFPDKQYHSAWAKDGRLKDKKLPPCVEHDPRGFDLLFVEFDQRGDFWDRDQLADGSRAIKVAATKGEQVLLIEYVHGWHNNALDDDPGRDVDRFRQLLSVIAQSKRVHELNYRVMGAYIGWRGETFRNNSNPLTYPLWIPHTASFYPEKHIGTEVGSLPMVTEAIFWLVHEARHNSPGARTILIGHSFGAMVLENAIAQAIASSVAGTPYEGKGASSSDIYTPADLVLLLNSAADSMRAKGLEEMLSRMGSSASRYISADRPLIISVTSTGDDATGTFFPIGTSLSNMAKGFRSYDTLNFAHLPSPISQRYFVTHTPGHNDYLCSHVVCIDKTKILPSTAAQLPAKSEPLPAEFVRLFDENVSNPVAPQGRGKDRTWRFRCLGKEGIAWSTIKVANYHSDKPVYNRTAYWIIEVPPEIIKDHSDIFNQQSLCLYGALFRIDNPNKVPAAELPRGPRLMQLPK
jgi:hypothetical protein